LKRALVDATAEFAPAKINLALHVLGRRADGYHELDSIVAFADVGDRLAFTPADRFSITASGPFAGELPPPADNIVCKAWQALQELAGPLPHVHVSLEKNLPVAAGLGGGSANAAATLRALLRLSGYRLQASALRDLALSLGADVPVCLHGLACRMEGVGERLTPLAGWAPLHAVLANPRVAVPTAEIFRAMGLARGEAHRAAIADMSDWAGGRNDMTEAAIALAPAIAVVLETLSRQPGTIAARMSGSGATCFAIFRNEAEALAGEAALCRQHPEWWVTRTVIA
jgi:4-diphosphocytidyl-2-C-methyl-D-erythritol kinase